MSEHEKEGQIVESGMSPEAIAALSEPHEMEGELPDFSGRTFERVSFEDVAECCRSADEQADPREPIPGVDENAC